VWLPAGDHTVEFRFQPRTFYCGAAISLVSWTLLGTLALLRRFPAFVRLTTTRSSAPQIE
jgi:hypothetical protein